MQLIVLSPSDSSSPRPKRWLSFASLKSLLCACVLLSTWVHGAQPTVKVGVLTDNEPYSFQGEDGRIQGFVVDMLAGIERHMSLSLERVSGTTPEITQAFVGGELDMLQSYARFPSREDHADFSAPYLSLSGSIFVRKGGAQPTTLEDLRGLKVLVHEGSLGDRLLREAGLGDSVVLVSSVEQSFRMLQDGTGDATLASRLSGLDAIHRLRLDQVKPSGAPLPNYAVEYCFAVRKGDRALLAQINEGLAVLQRTQEYDEIYRKWFGHLDPRRYTAVDIMRAIAIGLAIVFFVTLWFLFRQRSLHRRLALQASALERSEQLHRGLFDASPEGLALLVRAPGGTLQIEQANRAFAALLQQPWPLPLNVNLQSLLPEGHNLVTHLKESGATAGAPVAEHPLPPANGNPRWVRASFAPIGEGLLLVLSDISGEKAAQERLLASERQLRQAQKLEAIGTLASGIAHDFNNILTSIGAHTELARLQLPESEPVQAHLAEVTEATGRATALVRQILTFARQTESRRERLPVSRLVEETIGFLRAAAPSSLSLEHRRVTPPLEIDADPTQLHQVLMNLGTNAVQAIGNRPGRIVFSESRTADGAVCIEVSDTGPGMPPEVIARIFEPFYTTKAPHQGTGLGLSVVHGIMQAHRGAVSVESQLGQGTTFRLRFPAVVAAPPAAPVREETAPTAGRGELVLFVDDESSIIHMAGHLLPRLGYRVSLHLDPRDALHTFQQQPDSFALVISDLTMPGLSGLELISAVRRQRPDLPCILMSGFLGGEQLKRSKDAGLAGVLEKPLSVGMLSQAISQALAGQSSPASAS